MRHTGLHFVKDTGLHFVRDTGLHFVRHTGLHPVLVNYALSGLWERCPEGARYDNEGCSPSEEKRA